MTLRMLLGATLVGTALFAQTGVEFEVASIRPVEPIVAGAGRPVNVGVQIDGTQFHAYSMSLRDFLSMAYSVRIYQIDGPDWMTSDRFEISAKMPSLPPGSKLGEKDFGNMMRTLLEDRFQLKTHRAQKEFPVYALVQLKDGIKAKENQLDPVDERGVAVGGSGSAQGTVISLGRGSTLQIGGNRLEAKKMTMLALAETLARFVDRPVVDQTGLTSAYDILLELTPEDFQAMNIRSAIAAGVALPPQALKLLEGASESSLHEGLARAGLKLEPKKVPLEVVVVDSVNRKPTEN